MEGSPPLELAPLAVDVFKTRPDLFIFSPFGLGCLQCTNNVTIQIDERSIQLHLKKHGMDSRVSTVRSLFEGYKALLENAKTSQTIEPNSYVGYSCVCGPSFLKKGNAIRHCKRFGCDQGKLQKVELQKLRCGRYVSQAQVTSFFHEAPRITQQFDYHTARDVLLPFLPLREKHDHTYTHMFTPLISGCGGGTQFVKKIKAGFLLIHSPPSPSTQLLLVKLHQLAEVWLLNFAQKNIKMVPGNLRAALQTFEGGEVDNVSQRCTYSMQHEPSSFLTEEVSLPPNNSSIMMDFQSHTS